MDGILAVAASGLQVQTNRLGASANNVANSSSLGALPNRTGVLPAGQSAAYQPTEALSTAAVGGGASTVYRPLKPSVLVQSQPDSPWANSAGLVAAPNVDLTQEATTRLSANQAYQANLAVFKTSNQMFKSLLNTTA